MWSDHKRIEERSIALHQEIAKRIRANPELLQIAKNNLKKWIMKDGEIPVWREWQKILARPLEQIVDLLVSSDENARRMRQSSPFCGILTPRERWKTYETFTTGAYYKGGRKYR